MSTQLIQGRWYYVVVPYVMFSYRSSWEQHRQETFLLQCEAVAPSGWGLFYVKGLGSNWYSPDNCVAAPTPVKPLPFLQRLKYWLLSFKKNKTIADLPPDLANALYNTPDCHAMINSMAEATNKAAEEVRQKMNKIPYDSPIRKSLLKLGLDIINGKSIKKKFKSK